MNDWSWAGVDDWSWRPNRDGSVTIILADGTTFELTPKVLREMTVAPELLEEEGEPE